MAQKIVLVDDTDGTEGVDHTVKLGFEGETVSLDLSTKNYEKLKKLLIPYLEAGSQVKEEAPRRGSKAAKTSSPGTNAERVQYLTNVRTWARENDREVSDKGRVAQDIKDAYEAATGIKEPA